MAAIMEHTADYVILLRLAAHFGCRVPLVQQTLAVVEIFLKANAAHLPTWREEYEMSERDEVDFLSEEPFLTAERYEVLDSAFDKYRQGLIAVLEAREGELAQ